MKKILSILLMALMSFQFAACSDWFDISPKSDVKAEDLFSKEVGFRDALIGVYTLMSNGALYGKQLTFGFNDVLAQYYDRINNNSHQYIKTKTYEYDEPYNKGTLSMIWSYQYKGIANLNAMLKFIDENKGVFSSEHVYNIYKGEALALRGFLHFDLLRLFAPSPVMGEDLKAIPYMDTYTNIPREQLTVKEVLARVIEDLEAGRELLKESDPFGPVKYGDKEYASQAAMKNRVKHLNYYAAGAVLARVHLYAGNKEAALAAAKEIIGEPDSDPVAPFVLTNRADEANRLFASEHLFSLEQMKMEDMIDIYFGEEAAKYAFSQSRTILGMSKRSRDGLFEKQKPADDDYRLKLWFQETSETYNVMPNKLTGQTTIPMVHLSELYYIAAECDVQNGLAYLNRIRSHRGLTPLDEGVNIMPEIYTEYCKEFLCEGQMFYYYKRHGLSRIGVFRTYSKDPKQIYVIPFPDSEYDFGLVEY